MDWRPYESCCHARALDATVAVCPDCGHPLLRCRGFEACRTLLSPDEPCPVHVAPRLMLKPDTGLTARVSDRVDLPLILANASGCGAGLRVVEITRVTLGGEPRASRLYWDRLGAGEERELGVDSGELQTGGRTRVTIRLVLSATIAGQEEDYAFAAHVPIRVEGPSANRITQHIHVEGGQFAAGAAAVVQTGPSVREGFRMPKAGASGEPLVPLKLEHAGAFEVRQGVRGYPEAGLRVPRTVEIAPRGFPESDRPRSPYRPFMSGAEVRMGRNGRREHAGNPRPNDIALRVYSAAGGLDRERSMRVSGTHLRLFLANDRLVLQALGRNGLWLDGRKLHEREVAVVPPDARLRLLERDQGGPVLGVEMTSRGGQVSRIDLVRRRETHVLP